MNKVVKGASILAVCALAAKFIGAMYRIPLTNIVGLEGMGLYQMVFPLYTVLLTVSSGGLPVALSKLISAKIADGDEKGARRILFVALLTLTIIGFVASIIVVLARNQIALIQGNENASLAYIAIAPAVTFVAVIACFRGYFQGKQNMFPSAISQVTEQVVKLAASLYLAYLLLPYGVEVAVFGALIGVSISEFVTMIVLIIQYFFLSKIGKGERQSTYDKQHSTMLYEVGSDEMMTDNLVINNGNLSSGALLSTPQIQSYRSGNNKIKPQSKRQILKDIYSIAIPVTLGSLVMPLTQVVDSILVINILSFSGYTSNTATALYGLLTGPVNSLINMPAVIGLSVATALLPSLSERFHCNKEINSVASKAIKYNFLFGIFCAATISVFAFDIMSILYSSGLSAGEIQTGAMLLRVGSISIIFVSLLQVGTCILQACAMAQKPAIFLACGCFVKIILSIIFLQLFGIVGAMIASVLCYAVVCFLNIFFVRKFITLRAKSVLNLLKACVSVGASCAVGYWVRSMLLPLIGAFAALTAALAVYLITFIVFLVVLKVINADELCSIPPLKKLLKKNNFKR